MLIAAAEAVTLSSFLTDLGSVFEAMVGYVGNICQMIMSTPVLEIGFGITFVFAIVTLVKRLV